MYKLLVGAMVALFIAGIATPVLARDGQDDETSPSTPPTTTQNNEAEQKSQTEQRLNNTRSKIEATREQARERMNEVHNEVEDTIKSQKDQIESRKAELKQRIESERSERKSELTDKRLELCQQRQDKINELMAASAKFGRERLTHIQAVEARVKEFYTNKALTSTEYDAALTVVDEKEALAVAAVEVTESQDFDCTKVDGSKPSGEIRTVHEAKYTALNDYRDSVKQLIQIVKAAAVAAKTTDGSAQ